MTTKEYRTYMSFMNLIEEIVKIPQGTMGDKLVQSLNYHLDYTGSAMATNMVSHAIDIFMSGRRELAEQIIDIVEQNLTEDHPPCIRLREGMMSEDLALGVSAQTSAAAGSEEFAKFIIRIMAFATVSDHSKKTLNENDIIRTINEL